MAWALVYTTNTETDAFFVEGMLLTNDIPAQVVSQVDHTRAFTVGELAIAKVYVPTDHVSEALKLINEAQARSNDES